MDSRTSLILRIALAFAFLYPAVSAYFNPFAWIGYFPSFLLSAFSGNEMLLLHAFGALEILLALWILWGKRIWIPTGLAAAMLLGIVLFNVPQMDVLFRDIPILLIAVALFLSDLRDRKQHQTVE